MTNLLTGSLATRIDEVLRQVQRDEGAFNRIAEKEGLGVFMHKGKLYPEQIGHSHTRRILYGRSLIR
jgi:hypothetical protein